MPLIPTVCGAALAAVIKTNATKHVSSLARAVFIEDDKDFLARMDAAQRVAFEVERKGAGPQTVVFEVGGYDASKWAQLSKK